MFETNLSLEADLTLLHQQVLKLIQLQLKEDKIPTPPLILMKKFIIGS